MHARSYCKPFTHTGMTAWPSTAGEYEVDITRRRGGYLFVQHLKLELQHVPVRLKKKGGVYLETEQMEFG